jgi:hypothetical protein
MKYKKAIEQLLNIGNSISVYAGNRYIERDSSYETSVDIIHYEKNTSKYSLLISGFEIDMCVTKERHSEQYIAQEDEFINKTTYALDQTSIFIGEDKYTYDDITKEGDIPRSLTDLVIKLSKCNLRPLHSHLSPKENDEYCWDWEDEDNAPTSKNNSKAISSEFIPNLLCYIENKELISINKLANKSNNRILFLEKLNTYSEPILEVIIPKLNSSQDFTTSFFEKF